MDSVGSWLSLLFHMDNANNIGEVKMFVGKKRMYSRDHAVKSPTLQQET